MIERALRALRPARRRFNPYIVGTPVFDRHLFFGRDALARTTLERLASKSIQLTGERRIGKTSFLHHLKCDLRESSSADTPSFPVFVDLEAAPASGFFRLLMEETLETLEILPATLARLRVRAARNGYAEEDFSDDLSCVIGALGARAGRDIRLVLLIDEIDVLRASSEPAPDRWLAPLLRAAPPELRLVLAGASDGPGSQAGRDGELDRVQLQPLAPRDAEALVTRPVEGVFRYEPRAVERILEASRFRPFEIQRHCLNAVNRMLDADRTTVRLADVHGPA